MLYLKMRQNASSFFMDKELLANIKNNIQEMLNKRFDGYTYEKKRIYTSSNRLNFCCPICGDSADPNKHRGNLYLDSGRYYCFNCGVSSSLSSLLYDYDINLSLDDKIKLKELANSNHIIKTDSQQSQSDFLTFKILSKLAIPKDEFCKKFNAYDINRSNESIEYLKGRCLLGKQKHFLYNSYHKQLYVLNLTTDDRIIGYQIRNLSKDSNVRYLSFNIIKLYEHLNKQNELIEIINTSLKDENSTDIDINEIYNSLNKISMLFNIMTIDFYNDINICEGPIDSLFFKNTIALCGATKLKNYFDDLENVRYIFDNDNTGIRMSIEKLKKKKSVFMWKRFLNDCQIKDKIKDINDLIKYMGKNYSENLVNIIKRYYDYFTDDILDIANL